MDKELLSKLVHAYKNAPLEFQATSYWEHYEKPILDTINEMDFSQLRSGKYPILSTFGFSGTKYYYGQKFPAWKKWVYRKIHKMLDQGRPIMPYKLKIDDIHNLVFRNCELTAESVGAKNPLTIEASTFGNPQNTFEYEGKCYTFPFLMYYLRYCFVHKYKPFNGNEVIVELGSGSGSQVEILKKLFPKMTILCFDLPAQIFLCQEYLTQALPTTHLVRSNVTLDWQNLKDIKKGGVHFFGNWQFPLLADFHFDLFWNAASFGEMEPDVVQNYLRYVKSQADWVYLRQARHGKETSGKGRVKTPITFDNYCSYLEEYILEGVEDAWMANMKTSKRGGVFDAVWKLETF